KLFAFSLKFTQCHVETFRGGRRERRPGATRDVDLPANGSLALCRFNHAAYLVLLAASAGAGVIAAHSFASLEGNLGFRPGPWGDAGFFSLAVGRGGPSRGAIVRSRWHVSLVASYFAGCHFRDGIMPILTADVLDQAHALGHRRQELRR